MAEHKSILQFDLQKKVLYIQNKIKGRLSEMETTIQPNEICYTQRREGVGTCSRKKEWNSAT